MGKREVTIDVLLILAEFFGIAQRTNVKTGANANPVLSGILQSPQNQHFQIPVQSGIRICQSSCVLLCQFKKNNIPASGPDGDRLDNAIHRVALSSG